MDFVWDADEDEGGEDDVECGEAGQEDENAVPVGREPDVMHADEKFQRDFTEPCEQRWESCAEHAGDVAQHDEADDRDEHDVRVNLVALQFVLAEERERRVKPEPGDRQQRDGQRDSSWE